MNFQLMSKKKVISYFGGRQFFLSRAGWTLPVHPWISAPSPHREDMFCLFPSRIQLINPIPAPSRGRITALTPLRHDYRTSNFHYRGSPAVTSFNCGSPAVYRGNTAVENTL